MMEQLLFTMISITKNYTEIAYLHVFMNIVSVRATSAEAVDSKLKLINADKFNQQNYSTTHLFYFLIFNDFKESLSICKKNIELF